MKKAKAIIERGKDGTYGIYLDTEGLNYHIIGDGKTVEEAMDDFHNSYEEMGEHFEENGLEFTECEFVFSYDMASFLNYYSRVISLAGLGRLTGVNEKQLGHYLSGHRTPGKKTKEKIERKLKEFAEDLRQVDFV